jgi:hypothetical protein
VLVLEETAAYMLLSISANNTRPELRHTASIYNLLFFNERAQRAYFIDKVEGKQAGIRPTKKQKQKKETRYLYPMVFTLVRLGPPAPLLLQLSTWKFRSLTSPRQSGPMTPAD